MLFSHLAFLCTGKEHPMGTLSAPVHNPTVTLQAPWCYEFSLFACSLVCHRSPASPSALLLLVNIVVPRVLIEAAKCLVILSVPHMDGLPTIPNVLIYQVAKPLLRKKV